MRLRTRLPRPGSAIPHLWHSDVLCSGSASRDWIFNQVWYLVPRSRLVRDARRICSVPCSRSEQTIQADHSSQAQHGYARMERDLSQWVSKNHTDLILCLQKPKTWWHVWWARVRIVVHLPVRSSRTRGSPPTPWRASMANNQSSPDLHPVTMSFILVIPPHAFNKTVYCVCFPRQTSFLKIWTNRWLTNTIHCRKLSSQAAVERGIHFIPARWPSSCISVSHSLKSDSVQLCHSTCFWSTSLRFTLDRSLELTSTCSFSSLLPALYSLRLNSSPVHSLTTLTDPSSTSVSMITWACPRASYSTPLLFMPVSTL